MYITVSAALPSHFFSPSLYKGSPAHLPVNDYQATPATAAGREQLVLHNQG